ncbi:MAG TPA: MarC family protein [Thermoanaerobaculia bacterium]|nr:MarC family protein [Thermoanaerobaculia bacterium]
MMERLLRDALMLWSTIDPVGTLALFAALTPGLVAVERRRIALRATLYSGAILVGSMVIGQVVLSRMGIRLISLQVAGGIILFLFGLQMIFGGMTKASSQKPEAGHDLAVFPLAVPSIASPGAIMAVILLTDNEVYSVPQQLATGLVLLAILAITFAMMLFAGPILRVIGNSGAAILIRVMGMVLAALSVELVLAALGVGKWASAGP